MTSENDLKDSLASRIRQITADLYQDVLDGVTEISTKAMAVRLNRAILEEPLPRTPAHPEYSLPWRIERYIKDLQSKNGPVLHSAAAIAFRLQIMLDLAATEHTRPTPASGDSAMHAEVVRLAGENGELRTAVAMLRLEVYRLRNAQASESPIKAGVEALIKSLDTSLQMCGPDATMRVDLARAQCQRILENTKESK